MALDFPASGQALWDLFDSTGLRPEYAIICLYLESGLNPASVNSIGCVGLNQMCSPQAADYQSWPASRQLRQVVIPFWKSTVFNRGTIIQSGTRLEQGNVYPASLKTAKWSWQTVIDGKKDSVSYSGNAPVFDLKRKGRITVQDIADALQKLADKPLVQDSINRTYELRPQEIPLDPVYGSDFLYEGTIASAIDLVVDSVQEAGTSLLRRVKV